MKMFQWHCYLLQLRRNISSGIVSDFWRGDLGIYKKWHLVLGHILEIFLALGLRPRARKISEICPRTRAISYKNETLKR